MKGYLGTDITAWCGICGRWEFTGESTKQMAARLIRERGWRKTPDRGWLCPLCTKPAPSPGRGGEGKA